MNNKNGNLFLYFYTPKHKETDMFKILNLLFPIFAVLVVIPLTPGNDSLEEIDRLYSQSMSTGNYSQALSYAKMFYKKASTESDSSKIMLAYSHIGQSLLARDRYDSAYFYLNKGLEIWNSTDTTDRKPEQYYAIYAIYNGLGIYSINHEINYEKAIGYFLEGLRLAEKRSDYVNYAIFGSNMVVSYNLRKDTTGLKYAREVYEFGKKTDDRYIIYYGSYITAMMYFLKGDIPEAKKYLEETISLSEYFLDKRGMHCLYAQILASEGKYEEAEKYFLLSIDNISVESATTAISIYLTYADFLMGLQRYDEAIDMLDKGIGLASAKNNRVFTHRLYKEKSECLEKLGQPWEALEMYKKYHSESGDVFNLERERAINELTRKYENERHEKELQQRNITIIKRSRELQAALFSLAIIVAVLCVTFIMYRHKDKLYTRIAKQYKDAIQKQKGMEERIRQYETEQQNTASLTDDKNSELFKKLESLMKDSKVYREKNLTRERIADLIGSNRTYLSQVINEMTGMSFVHYINSYRIDEALEILSDAENEIPLKALCSDLGFSSLTTFYKLFQAKVGMTPAKYREKIIELSKNDN